MRKWITISLVMIALTTVGHSQSTWWKEWFKQSSTQQEYLLKQIAALKVYVEYARKGYEIYDSGLKNINRITHGDLSLHEDFFESLKGINPEIARYGRVGDIIRLQLRTVRSYNNIKKQINGSAYFKAGEVSYISRVYGRVIGDCTQILDELTTITTSGKIEMSDDERLGRIDKLYNEMLDLFKFSQSFGTEIVQVDRARKKGLNDIKFLKHIKGLKL